MSSNHEKSQDMNARLSNNEETDHETRGDEQNKNKTVDFCCCCSLKRPSFYLFINMLDLVMITMVTSLMATIGASSEMGNLPMMFYIQTALGTLNAFLFIVAIAAFVVYLIKLRYDTSIHKVYAWIRIVLCALK